jgi:hypothetical protein
MEFQIQGDSFLTNATFPRIHILTLKSKKSSKKFFNVDYVVINELTKFI